ncbi:MAG: tRNA (adenine-N1)-methyltransferase [Candidatus Hadarchaeaceae archaeon]
MISEGDRIILIDGDGRKYLVQVGRQKLHTKFGVIDIAETIGKEPGTKIKSHLGKDFIVLRPSIVDFLQKLRRVPQIMLPKDAGQIVAHTGVGPGSKVVDAGAGSGALSIFLGNLVRPTGWVVSYEVREDFAKIAEENIRTAGLDNFVRIKNRDIYEGIDESELDLVTLDLPQPELVLPHAQQAIKPGGYLAAFTPCMEHLQRMYREFTKFNFADISTIECLVREMEVKANCTRPSTRMIAHTGYLTFARRI